MGENDIQQELAFIKKVMEDSRQFIVDDGKLIIAWGILIIFGIILTYGALFIEIPFDTNLVWIGLIGMGLIGTYQYNKKYHARHQAQSFARKVLVSLWGACGMTVALIGFLPGPSAEKLHLPSVGVGFACMVIGIGFFVSSILYKSTWVRGCAIGWWLGGCIILLWPGMHTLAIFGALVVLFQIFPGILLYEKWKKQMGGQ